MLDFMTYREYCKKVYGYDDNKMKNVKESDGNYDAIYQRYLEETIMEQDEKEA